MLKKISWIAAAFITALAMVFIGCPTEMGGMDDGSAPRKAEDLVLTGDDIILKACGSAQAKVVIDGTKVTLDGNNTGFYFDFPEAAAEYADVQVFFEIVEVMAGTGPGLLIKKNTKFENAIGITSDQDPAYQLNNVGPAGTKFDTGVWKTNRFDKQMAFQNQIYNPAGNADSKFTLEVLKIVFPGGGEPPVELLPPAYTGAAGKVAYKTAGNASIIEDTDPSITGDFGMTFSGNVITMTEGSILYYKFPTSALDGTTAKAVDLEKDYDFIEFAYTISDVALGDKTQASPAGTGPSDGNLKVRVRDYNNEKAYIGFAGANEWPSLGGEGDQTWNTQTWGAQGSGGIAILYNWNDRHSSGALSLKIKITKVTFTKGTRYTVDFLDPIGKTSGSAVVLEGNSLGSNLPSPAKIPGYTFFGWYPVWDKIGLVNQDKTTVSSDLIGPKAGSGTAISSAVFGTYVSAADKLKLYGYWFNEQLDPIVINVGDSVALGGAADANGTLFKALGSYAGSGADGTNIGGINPTVAAATYTYEGNKYWIVANGHSGNYTWDKKVDGIPQATFDAIKLAQGSYGSTPGYTRIGLTFPTDALIYDRITITYDAVEVGGDNPKNVEIRQGDSGTGSNIGKWPDLSGTNQTVSFTLSELGGSGITIVKNNNGAFLVRITKIEFSFD